MTLWCQLSRSRLKSYHSNHPLRLRQIQSTGMRDVFVALLVRVFRIRRGLEGLSFAIEEFDCFQATCKDGIRYLTFAISTWSQISRS